MLAVLSRSRGLCGRSGAEKCEEHGYLENVLSSRAGMRSAAWGSVLGRSWALCWRSWVALGPYVGGLEPLLGPMLAVLGCSWALSWGSWPKSGPNPSGSKVLGGRARWDLRALRARWAVRGGAWRQGRGRESFKANRFKEGFRTKFFL